MIAAVVIAIRVGFRDAARREDRDARVVPVARDPAAGVVGHPRSAGRCRSKALLGALYDGLRLATLLVCFGAANVLANPKRLIKAAPAALHEVGVAVTVAVTVAPQLIDSARRVRRARRLRSGRGKGMHLVRQVLIPVVTDALDRSLSLAAAMDTRGHGRTDWRFRCGRGARAARSSFSGCAACASAPTGCSTDRCRALLARRRWCVGVGVERARGRARRPARARAACTGPTRGARPEWVVAAVRRRRRRRARVRRGHVDADSSQPVDPTTRTGRRCRCSPRCRRRRSASLPAYLDAGARRDSLRVGLVHVRRRDASGAARPRRSR